MDAANFNLPMLLEMRHSPIRNYVVPGVTSWLIGSPSAAGTVRLFESTRDHQEEVTPHSHRFDFQCWVLRGTVRNRVWLPAPEGEKGADLFQSSRLTYWGATGGYAKVPETSRGWRYDDDQYTPGQCYAMKSDAVHSIHFSRGALVLFFEGPQVSDSSIVLEPVVDGEVIPTFRVEPWMFRKEEPSR